ncbi:unnamed protein product [Echinostoma caproni]|uniref:Tetraspanin n=1 Tax=Echinostoma caproni TaxID=27848 RepID=A0A182ZZB8_9TREM|nr:unnamed protein product [Echinostoma caproni]
MLCNLPCRIVLFAVNFLTSLFGLVLVTVGGIMIWGQPIVHQLLERYLDPFIDSISPDSTVGAYSEIISRLLTATSPIGILLFVLGSVIFITSLIGYSGACCNSKMIYYTYEIILALLAAAIVAAVVGYYFQKEKLADVVDKYFAKSVNDYVSMAANDVNSLVVGFLSPLVSNFDPFLILLGEGSVGKTPHHRSKHVADNTLYSMHCEHSVNFKI